MEVARCAAAYRRSGADRRVGRPRPARVVGPCCPGDCLARLFDDTRPPALLALADGSVFQGVSIGASGSICGEVVFNTALTGYQEILSDPSYCRQIVTLTYPHIGNVGANPEDDESSRVYAAGLIVRDLARCVSNFRSTQSLDEYLIDRSCVRLSSIVTRRPTLCHRALC